MISSKHLLFENVANNAPLSREMDLCTLRTEAHPLWRVGLPPRWVRGGGAPTSPTGGRGRVLPPGEWAIEDSPTGGGGRVLPPVGEPSDVCEPSMAHPPSPTGGGGPPSMEGGPPCTVCRGPFPRRYKSRTGGPTPSYAVTVLFLGLTYTCCNRNAALCCWILG